MIVLGLFMLSSCIRFTYLYNRPSFFLPDLQVWIRSGKNYYINIIKFDKVTTNSSYNKLIYSKSPINIDIYLY